jgi:hypothetical protein
VKGRLGHNERECMAPTELVSALMARRRGGQWSAANALVKTWAGRGSDERAWAASGRATREGEGSRALTGRPGVSGAGAGARSWAAWAVGGRREERAHERGEVAWAGKRPSRGGRVFPFSFSIFYFSFLFSISISFYLLFF